MQRDNTSEQDKEIEFHNDGTLTPVCLCNEPRSHGLRVISTSISGKCSSKPDRVATDTTVLFIRSTLVVERVRGVYQLLGTCLFLLDTRLFLLDTRLLLLDTH